MQFSLVVVVAALLGGLSVILGAFGAHALKAQLSDYQLGIWQTAVQYHMVHAVVLLIIGLLIRVTSGSVWLSASAILFALGIMLFSGSLYGLALGGPKWLGPVTPLGGMLLIIGWLSLVIFGFNNRL